MSSTIFLKRASKCRASFSLRIFVQFMGGGPRTFPGGINKWQWKRLHEKRAKEKEKRLLEQEKQVYEARIRSEIRSRLSGSPSNQSGISSKQQIKLLADRFVKEGAEDLWNENDGPSIQPSPSSITRFPSESFVLSKLSNGTTRSYSTNTRNPRFSSSADEGRKLNSDAIPMKRNPKRPQLRRIEDEILSQEVDLIRTQHEQRKNPKLAPEIEPIETNSAMSSTKFDELEISPLTIKALSASGYVNLTDLQSSALPSLLEGKDALIKSQMGTQKSCLFLIPSIEAALNSTKPSSISALVLCSTRESVSQIAAEANAMLRYHNGIQVQALYGGKRFKDDVRALKEQSCKIVVATPGRLIDHIEDRGGICGQLMGLKLLVVDEGDKLVELGFWEDIERIIDCVPRQRQTILFTGSVSNDIRRLSLRLLRKHYAFADG